MLASRIPPMAPPMARQVLVVLSLMLSGLLAAASCTTGATPMCGDGAMCGPGFDGPLPEGSITDAGDAGDAGDTGTALDTGTDSPVDAPVDTAATDVAEASKG
jgi:hypothetical protein